MLKVEKKQFLIVGLNFEVMTFLLLFVGVRGVLGNELTTKNILAFVIFSTLVAIVAAVLVFFNLKIMFSTFIIGLVIGFFQMFGAFFNGMSGWGDLIGIISLFTWLVIGLGAGVLIQIGFYLYKKLEKR